MTAELSVSVVVLAYQADPWLSDCIQSLLGSTGVRVQIVLVDNGCSNPALPALGRLERVRILQPGDNLGYSGGCNAGAAAAEGDVLVFVNSDCVVERDALSVLADAACRTKGLVTASVRLSDDSTRLNTAGNPVHFLGFSWAGRLGELASSSEDACVVTSVSGACFGLSRHVWIELGGFPDAYFAYHEDVELSLRCWLSGRPVHYVPQAVAHHYYEFSRNPQKMYLLERNRLLTWFTVLQPRTLALLLPAMIVAELAVIVVATRQGWLRQKVRGWLWLLQHVPWIRRRRRANLLQRRRTDRALASLLTSTFNPGGSVMPKPVALANAPLRVYWRAVQTHLLRLEECL